MLECYGAVSTSLGPAVTSLHILSPLYVKEARDSVARLLRFQVTSIVYADRLRAGFNSKANMGSIERDKIG